MATVETVKIVFEVDDQDLKTTVDGLVKAGKAAEEDAAKFKKFGDEAKKAGDELDNFVKKGKELPKVSDGAEKANKSFVSLKSQLKESKEELQRLSDEFGEFSAEANAARARAGQLADQMSDLNRQVNLLNPEAKAKAFVNFGQGVVGAFQVATGALQAFGAENEEVQKIAMRLQGALNVVQGIASIKQLKEAYQDVKVVLGVTTAAQNVLTTATTAGGVAATGAATATRGFTAALVANPFTAVAVAIGAVAGAFLLLRDNTDESTEATNENTDAVEKNIDAYRDYQSAQKDRIDDVRTEIALLKGEITPLQKNLLKIEQERTEALKQFSANDIINRANVNKEFNLRRELAILQDQQSKKKKEDLKITREQIELLQKIGITDQQILGLSDEELQQVEFYLKLITSNAYEVRKAMMEVNKELDKIEPKTREISAAWKGSAQELIDSEDEKKDKAASTAQSIADITIATSDFVSDLRSQAIEKEIQDLERQRELGIITEEQYQEKLKGIKEKQARADKQAAIFEATIRFGLALINALTTTPANAAPFALAAAATVAGLNLAKIIATPIPKFKEGTLNFQGGKMDSDGGALAILHPNEAVIPADRNRAYHPTLEAIYKKQIKPSELNAFVLNKLAGKGSIGRDTQITASVDTYALSRAMSRNKGVEVTNAQMIGAAVANELSKRINPRQVI